MYLHWGHIWVYLSTSTTRASWRWRGCSPVVLQRSGEKDTQQMRQEARLCVVTSGLTLSFHFFLPVCLEKRSHICRGFCSLMRTNFSTIVLICKPLHSKQSTQALNLLNFYNICWIVDLYFYSCSFLAHRLLPLPDIRLTQSYMSQESIPLNSMLV